MITLKVDGMHCEKCVSRIDNVLTEANINHTIDLATKTVCVEADKKDLAISELDDIGFEAE